MIWEDVLAKFKELFGDEGEIGVYFAPGRVNMIGEHPITTEDTFSLVHSPLVHMVWQEKEMTRNFVSIL